MMKLILGIPVILLLWTSSALTQEVNDGLANSLNNVYRVSNAKSFSISPENLTGEKGKGGMATTGVASDQARDLGQGWKVNPYVIIKPGATFTLAEISGAGAIQHIWMTPTGNWRFSILRMYWDDETEPSVEVPVGDFFAVGWGKYARVSSLPICVNPGSAFNSYWPMPFRHKAKITMENIDQKPMAVYYQIDYALSEVPKDAAYFHAQFRRVNPLPYKQVYTIVDNVKGKGQYVGTYMAWGVHSNGWWGEGEIKFYLDGDRDFPTINGTGTEDYFNGSYDFENQITHQYEEFSGPYTGLPQVIKPDGLYQSQQRFGLYRWHIVDPVRFEKDLRITIQDLGWREGKTYLPLMDDISSVAYWYQIEPHAPFPKLPEKEQLELN
ncbi:MAG TPA: glycoside hydrolase family 172 protein [Candidatus Polarisedimenticolia bacterium]|nr:glycoside hydrolase family 172 protein [Candidatus Polarisedimenticolia bacterium]